MKGKELKKWMDSTKVSVEMSISDILILHAIASLADGRGSLIKLLKRTVTPVAMKILEEHKELT